jgi:hypothetical protein
VALNRQRSGYRSNAPRVSFGALLPVTARPHDVGQGSGELFDLVLSPLSVASLQL